MLVAARRRDGRRWCRGADIDVAQVRGAGLRVLDRRRFRARGLVSVPEPAPGIHAMTTYAVDLDRGLSRQSTVTVVDPGGALDPGGAGEQPLPDVPVTTWSTRDGLLVPLPSGDPAGPVWACVPGEPVLQGPLAMLLCLPGAVTVGAVTAGAVTVGAVTAGTTPSGAAWSVVVDVDLAVGRVPSQHRAALQRFLQETGLHEGSQLGLELRLAGGAVATLEAQLPAADGSGPGAVLHCSVDAGPVPAVPEPPAVGTVASAEDVARAWVADRPGDLPVHGP